MRKKHVWRFYCDFCKKSGCSGGHIAKHEKSCTRNPDRVCGICTMADLEQQPTADLLAALERDGVEGVKKLAESCPACVMAAIHALRKKVPLELEGGEPSNFIEYNYQTQAAEFWSEFRKGPL